MAVRPFVVFRQPWQRQKQRKPKIIDPFVIGSAANTIGPFISNARGSDDTGHAANTIGPFISAAVGTPTVVGTAANTIGAFISTANGLVYEQNFVPGQIVGAVNPCLTQVTKSYLYIQYNDDDDLQAFVSAYNQLSQQFVNWMNAFPLGVYTNPLLTGALLDWVATGLYGVARPVLTSGRAKIIGALNTYEYNTLHYGGERLVTPASYTTVNDDIYKRVLTWKLYKGDGKYINVQWLKRRVYRFLYGVNGSDPNAADTSRISVTFGWGSGVTITTVDTEQESIPAGAIINTFAYTTRCLNQHMLGSRPIQVVKKASHGNQININIIQDARKLTKSAAYNTFAFNTVPMNNFKTSSAPIVPPVPNAETFKEAIEQGVLDMPFQFETVVNIL